MFDDISTGNISSWKWDFSDGPGATVQHPVHTYAVADTFDVQLTVVDINGCKDSLRKARHIIALPGVDGGVDFLMCLASGSRAMSGNPEGGTWAGQGITGAQFNPALSGIGDFELVYTIMLNGNPIRDTVQAKVVPMPKAGFTASPLSGSLPLFVQFTDTSIGPIAKWFWYFGDANTWTIQNPAHQYWNPGIYTVSLVVEDSNGCHDSVSIPALINVVVGLEEKGKTTVFLVYPNPAKNEIIVKLNNDCNECMIQLIDAAGKIVHEEKFAQRHLQISRNGLPAGTYLLKFTGFEGAQEVRKVIFE